MRSDPQGLQVTTLSGRSIQIASNLVQTWNGPVAIDLFCSLIFILSITEILLCEVNAHFPGRFVPMILANHIQFNVWGTLLARIDLENVH